MIKEFFTSLLHYFVNIITAVIIAVAVYLTISGQQIDSTMLWQILFSGFITALPSAILVCIDTKSGKVLLMLWFLHFLLIFGLTLVMLKLFGWCDITPVSTLITFCVVVFIYLFTSYVHYLVDRSHVALMNQKLKKRYFKAEYARELAEKAKKSDE